MKTDRRINRQPTHLPKRFFLTDIGRLPDWRLVVANLPPASGVILRELHHRQRQDLAADMARLCRHHGHVFLIAGDLRLARQFAAGLHVPEKMAASLCRSYFVGRPLTTIAIHGMRGLIQANRLYRQGRVDAGFISPLFPTASHPQQSPLGRVRFIRLCRQAKLPIYALGGMSEQRYARLLLSMHSVNKRGGGASLVGYGAIGYFAEQVPAAQAVPAAPVAPVAQAVPAAQAVQTAQAVPAG